MRLIRNSVRVFNNGVVVRVLKIERKLGLGVKFEDIAEVVSYVYSKVMADGDMDAGSWSCGIVAGLINDMPICQELIECIMAEAEAIVRQYLLENL